MYKDGLSSEKIMYLEELSLKGHIFFPIKKNYLTQKVFLQFRDAICELPIDFTSNEGVRKKYDDLFHNTDEEVMEAIYTINLDQVEELHQILTILIQSYRWNKCPPSKEQYNETNIFFPRGLYEPWSILCSKLGLPLCNTYTATIGTNWSFVDSSDSIDIKFSLESFLSKKLKVKYNWLPEPHKNHLENFLLSFVEMEAHSPQLINIMIKIYHAIHKKNDVLVIENLHKMYCLISSMNKTFGKKIRSKLIPLETWKTIVHIPFGWGLDSDQGRLEGASGMQVGTIIILNSFLGLPNNSKIAKATYSSRKYLKPEQIVFLNHLDSLSHILKEYSEQSHNLELQAEFNKSVRLLATWRASHQKRGAKYLGYKDENAPQQMATGLTLPEDESKDCDLESIFVKEMQERIEETNNWQIIEKSK